MTMDMWIHSEKPSRYLALIDRDGAVSVLEGATWLSAAELAAELVAELEGSRAETIEIKVRVR